MSTMIKSGPNAESAIAAAELDLGQARKHLHLQTGNES